MENNFYRLYSLFTFVKNINIINLIFNMNNYIWSCYDEVKKLIADKKAYWTDPEFGSNAILKYNDN